MTVLSPLAFGVFLARLASAVVIYFSSFRKVFGQKKLDAIERLMEMLLVIVTGQTILTGKSSLSDKPRESSAMIRFSKNQIIGSLILLGAILFTALMRFFFT